MRVCKCPKCGEIIVDNPLWRPSGFKWGVDHASLDDFKIIDFLLAQKLEENGQWVEDELYIYRLSKYGNVSRMAKLEYVQQFLDEFMRLHPKVWGDRLINIITFEPLKKETEV